jgi:hypothetical protein
MEIFSIMLDAVVKRKIQGINAFYGSGGSLARHASVVYDPVRQQPQHQVLHRAKNTAKYSAGYDANKRHH